MLAPSAVCANTAELALVLGVTDGREAEPLSLAFVFRHTRSKEGRKALVTSGMGTIVTF